MSRCSEIVDLIGRLEASMTEDDFKRVSIQVIVSEVRSKGELDEIAEITGQEITATSDPTLYRFGAYIGTKCHGYLHLSKGAIDEQEAIKQDFKELVDHLVKQGMSRERIAEEIGKRVAGGS